MHVSVLVDLPVKISVKERIGNPDPKPGDLNLVFWKGKIVSMSFGWQGCELFSVDRYIDKTSLTNWNNSCIFWLL